MRIVLVDDRPDLRLITRLLLCQEADMTVVGEASNGAEALEVVAEVQPDVVLMDVEMPILDGIAATQRLRAADPDLPVVLWTGCADEFTLRAGLRAGAVGYLLKTARREELVAAIRRALAGHDSA